MNNLHSFFTLNCHSLIARLFTLTLIAVVWSSLTGCAEWSSMMAHDEASYNRNLGEFKVLLKSNSDLVFKRDATAQTLLHFAAFAGHKEMVELLIANGAEVNARDMFGMTPLSQAENGGHGDVAALLRQHGAR
jgi:ankyrin repeat protein